MDMTRMISNGNISVYDSLFRGGPISSSLQVQLSLIYKTKIVDEEDRKVLYIELPTVQQQLSGTNNCGVFAIAFAYHAGKSVFTFQPGQSWICNSQQRGITCLL